MRTKAARMMTAMTAASIATAMALAGPAGAGGRPLETTLTGSEEAPANPHGNADWGSVRLTLNQGQGEICFEFGALILAAGELAAGEPLPFAGHIHEAPPGEPGPIVVPLFSRDTAPTSYPTDEACVEANPALIKEIRQNPEDYYVNLHNETHPSGVVRGQLGDE